MSKRDEALKLALDNLIAEYYMENSSFAKRVDDIFKEVPAQPQQEPIYQLKKADGSWIDQAKHSYDYNVKHGHATVRVVYPSPQPAQRKPLTDEQIAAIGKELGLKCRLGGNPNIDFDYAKAIEAAHGIKGEA